MLLFSGHSLLKDAKHKSHWGHHCAGSRGWDRVRSSRGLSEAVAGLLWEEVVAQESGNYVVVKANTLQAAVLLLFFKSTYPHHTRPQITVEARMTNKLGRSERVHWGA